MLVAERGVRYATRDALRRQATTSQASVVGALRGCHVGLIACGVDAQVTLGNQLIHAETHFLGKGIQLLVGRIAPLLVVALTRSFSVGCTLGVTGRDTRPRVHQLLLAPTYEFALTLVAHMSERLPLFRRHRV